MSLHIGDTGTQHLKGIEHGEDTQHMDMQGPTAPDMDQPVPRLFDMIRPGARKTQPLRPVFILDHGHKVRRAMTCSMTIGYTFNEVLRAIDAVQRAAANSTATSADRTSNDKIILPPFGGGASVSPRPERNPPLFAAAQRLKNEI